MLRMLGLLVTSSKVPLLIVSTLSFTPSFLTDTSSLIWDVLEVLDSFEPALRHCRRDFDSGELTRKKIDMKYSNQTDISCPLMVVMTQGDRKYYFDHY